VQLRSSVCFCVGPSSLLKIRTWFSAVTCPNGYHELIAQDIPLNHSNLELWPDTGLDVGFFGAQLTILVVTTWLLCTLRSQPERKEASRGNHLWWRRMSPNKVCQGKREEEEDTKLRLFQLDGAPAHRGRATKQHAWDEDVFPVTCRQIDWGTL
jgi:hypothetical protein